MSRRRLSRRRRRVIHRNGFFLAMAAVLVALPATGEAPFDGSTTLICASIQTISCNVDGLCESGDADDVRIPDFLKVDFKKKKITALDPERRGESTEIRTLERAEGRLILQGVENGRGWNLALSEATGNTVLTVSDPEAGFVVFGECTEP
jgi:hypothetical protein